MQKLASLTHNQQEALYLIESTDGAVLSPYVNPKNRKMYRLHKMPGSHPIQNIPERMILDLYDKARLTKDANKFYPVSKLGK